MRGQGSDHKRASNARSRQRPAIHSGMPLSSAGKPGNQGPSFHREKPEQSSLPPELSLSPQKRRAARKPWGGQERLGPEPPKRRAAPRAGARPPGKKGRDLRAASIWGVSAPRAAHSSGLPEPGDFRTCLFILLHLNQEQS